MDEGEGEGAGEGELEHGSGGGYDCDRGQLLDRGLLLLMCRWSAQYPHDPVRDEVR